MWLGGEVPEYTSIFTNLILLNMLLGSLNLPISQAIQAVGKIRIYQTVRSVIVISALPVSWLILADGTPAYMVFVVLIIVNLINQPVSMFLLRKVFNYSYLDYYRKVLFAFQSNNSANSICYSQFDGRVLGQTCYCRNNIYTLFSWGSLFHYFVKG